MEERQKKEDEDWRRLREDGSKAKKNQSNVAYDIMTLQYSQDQDGQQQKYLDDMGTLLLIFVAYFGYICGDTNFISIYDVFLGINSEVSSDPTNQHACCEGGHSCVLQHHQW